MVESRECVGGEGAFEGQALDDEAHHLSLGAFHPLPLAVVGLLFDGESEPVGHVSRGLEGKQSESIRWEKRGRGRGRSGRREAKKMKKKEGKKKKRRFGSVRHCCKEVREGKKMSVACFLFY